MAKMSQTVKEIIQIVVFLIVVGLLLTSFVFYPLNRTRAITARLDIDDFNPDSLPLNDPTAFIEAGFTVDTFRIDADGVTSLACLYLASPLDSSMHIESDPKGTVVLVHDEQLDRKSMITLALNIVDSGFTVVVYDQRACEYSSAGYHSDGQYEAADLTELIAWLGLRRKIHHPFITVGYSAGADAVLLASIDDSRLDGLIAVNPYLTSDRWLYRILAENEMLWIPFRKTVFTFWYELRSSYSYQARGLDDIKSPGCPAILMVPPDEVSDPAVTRISETASESYLLVKEIVADSLITGQIFELIKSIKIDSSQL